MRQLVIVLAILMVVVIVSLAISNAPAAAADGGVLSVLKVGQTVVVKDLGEKLQIEISTRKLTSNYKVVEVSRDYVVLSHKPRLHEVRIPLSSVKWIVHDKR